MVVQRREHRIGTTAVWCVAGAHFVAPGRRWLIPTVCLGIIASVDGCDEPMGPYAFPVTRVEGNWVTGAAAAALNSNGQFVFPRPDFQVTSPERADSVALAFLQFDLTAFGSAGAPYVWQQFGAPMDFATLKLCERQYYVRTAVGTPPPIMPTDIALYFASQYMIPFCTSGGRAEMAIIVADGPYPIQIANGQFVPPWDNGNDFEQWGIPQDVAGDMPTTPEEAVRFAALSSGARVAGIPVPLVWYPDTSPGLVYNETCVRWRVQLDRFIRVRNAAGVQTSTDVMYVNRAPACFPGTLTLENPLPAQPTSFTARFLTDSDGVTMNKSAVVPLVGPTRFEPVFVMQ
jgi:hypothetical protein